MQQGTPSGPFVFTQKDARALAGKIVADIERKAHTIILKFTDGTKIEIVGDSSDFAQFRVFIYRISS